MELHILTGFHMDFNNIDKSSVFPLSVRTVVIEQNVGGVKHGIIPLLIYVYGRENFVMI